jgi:hypothetical protein
MKIGARIAHLGIDVAVVEVGQELGDEQEQEQQPDQRAPLLDDRVDHVGAGLDRARAAPERVAGHEEDERDHEYEAVHERRVADHASRLGVANGAPGIAVSSVITATTPSKPHTAKRSPLASASGETSTSSVASSASPAAAGS